MSKSVANTILINLGLGCLSVIKDDEVRLVYDNNGTNTIPSAITFKGIPDLGEDLSELDLTTNTKNTILWANLLNSLTLNDDNIQFIKNHSLFELIYDDSDIQIEIKSTTKTYHPEILSGTSIACMKHTAEKYLGIEVEYAVIAVPANFNNQQRQATKLGAERAGLKLLQLITEPKESLISFDAKKKHLFLYDLQQASFNVSILEASEKNLVVKTTNQNLTNELTIELVEKCMNRTQLTTSDIDSVIMIGDSSSFPTATKLLEDFFPGTPVLNEKNTDKAVATAAALLTEKKLQINLQSYAIGIDLGTTNSCVYVIKDGQPKLIQNFTPSAIAFKKNGVLYGENAMKHNNDKNIIRWMKIFMGRKYEDKVVERMKESCCFEILNFNSNVKIVVDVGGECKTFFPEELNAIFISYLVHIAEEFLGEPVTKAVISVPANFNNAQRQATKLAAELAGLEVLALLNEPTAAAMAYMYENENKKQQMLVYDLGGGTLDVSIIEVNGENLTVKGVEGNTDLGGEKFTERLINYCEGIKDAINIQRNGNVKPNTRHREQCERAKRILSTNKTVKISLEGLDNNDECSVSNSQEDFIELNIDLLRSTIDTVQECLKESRTNKNDIDNIIMIGGSSHIPEVKRLLQNLFPNTRLTKLMKPDELVAMGAALLADQLNKGVKLINVYNDVAPLLLGIDSWNNEYGVQNMTLIQRNTKIPATVTRQYFHKSYSAHPIQSIKVLIYEDKHTVTVCSNLLGIFEIYIESSPNMDRHINVTCDIDSNGILKVHANLIDHTNRGNITKRLEVDHYWIRSENEINMMMERVKQNLFHSCNIDLI